MEGIFSKTPPPPRPFLLEIPINRAVSWGFHRLWVCTIPILVMEMMWTAQMQMKWRCDHSTSWNCNLSNCEVATKVKWNSTIQHKEVKCWRRVHKMVTYISSLLGLYVLVSLFNEAIHKNWLQNKTTKNSKLPVMTWNTFKRWDEYRVPIAQNKKSKVKFQLLIVPFLCANDLSRLHFWLTQGYPLNLPNTYKKLTLDYCFISILFLLLLTINNKLHLLYDNKKIIMLTIIWQKN